MGSMQRPRPPSPALPDDLLRKVLALCDHETLVRCAAGSRLLCRCMLDDPAFLRRRRAQGYAPSLLLGIFHHASDGAGPRVRFAEAPTPAVIPRAPIGSFVSGNADLLTSFDEPLACRGGLVLLRRGKMTRYRTVELCVCEPMTGRRRFLPPPDPHDQSIAILTAQDAGGRFELLAAGLRVFTSHQHITSQLFTSPGPFPYMKHDVLALHADDGRAELINGPDAVRSDIVLLATTADGRRLSLLVVDERLISMLVLLKESGNWERHATVVRDGILAPPRWIRLDFFGQRSGTVFIGTDDLPGRLLLNLETKEVAHMPAEQLPWRCCLYEMDLLSLATALLKYPST
ncbi:hypothetical protein ACP70R_019892 [Stipagrostis hirtigluma subsp. patula]